MRACPKRQYSALAQLVEQMTVNHWVAGSSPAGGAKYSKKASALAEAFLFSAEPISEQFRPLPRSAGAIQAHIFYSTASGAEPATILTKMSA
jgi:hypothetical protein